MATKLKQEELLQGAPVSEGIAIGEPFFLSFENDEEVPEFPITLSEVDAEIDRYRRALFSSKEDLVRLQQDLVVEGSSEAVSFIDAHIQMLADPLITVQMEDNIRHRLRNTESVFHSVIRDYEKQFFSRSDAFFRERFIDVKDLSRRILSHLCRKQSQQIAEIPRGSIVFAKELSPSHTAAAQSANVAAFVTQYGGGNSHAALIARAKGIPYITSIDIQLIEEMDCKTAIVNGTSGELILNPLDQTLEKYIEMRNQMKTRYQLYEKENLLLAETIDGFRIHLYANIGSLSDLERFPYPIEGVGLFRTEYLFLQNHHFFPSEEEQYEAYSTIFERLGNMPIVFRVFDVGGDKNPELFLHEPKEPNPVLGCRGIRFLLRKKRIFRTQLRALLLLSKEHTIQILLPLVSDLNEFVQAKAYIEEVRQELIHEGHLLLKPVRIGCMIEVPSSVILCEALAEHADFLSIGTNDLLQYTLGIDRANPVMSHHLYPAHPTIIQMIKMIVVAAEIHQKPVTICGELASNPRFVPLLIGLGLTRFSCTPRYLPLVKRAIRSTTLIDAFQLAEKALTVRTSDEMANLL